MNSRKYNIYQFPECKDIVVSGDIHGDFNLLVNKICVQYQMRNTLVIVAGDCGFGFDKRGYYDNMGKNTMERQNFIIENLVIEEDIPEEDSAPLD